MFWKSYWMILIQWRFWSWKTWFATYYLKKKKEKGAFVISNVPFSFVDVYYWNESMLQKILEYLVKMYYLSNNKLKNNYRQLVLLIDEAHIYFFSRLFYKFKKEYLIFFTQLRKRNVEVILITQNFYTIDRILRRLINFVLTPRKIIRRYFTVQEIINPEDVNIYDIEQEWKKWERYLNPFISWFLNAYSLKTVKEEKKLTNYIVGADEILKWTDKLKDFIQKEWF